MNLRLKRALVVAGLILVVVGFIVDRNLVKGLGFGVFLVGFFAAGGV